MNNISSQGGFTLVEIMVTIVIIGIVSLLVLRAYPLTRDAQALQSAKQQIEEVLADALQRAMNDTRNETCLSVRDAISDPDQKHLGWCSNIGVTFIDNKIVMFADTNGDNEYSTSNPTDNRINEVALTSGVTVSTVNKSFLFIGNPPSVSMLVDASGISGQVTLKAGRKTASLQILPYGKVQLTSL